MGADIRESLGLWTKSSHLTKAKEKNGFCVPDVLDLQGHFTLGLCILNRGQPMLGNSERKNYTHNLIPEGMNARGTTKQENKIFLHVCNFKKDKK